MTTVPPTMDEIDTAAPRGATRDHPWLALWTRSHCERRVHDQLAGMGFHPYLPRVPAFGHRGAEPRRTLVPMFPGYLFVHDALGKQGYLQVVRARGLVAVLGGRWDRLAEIPAAEIAAIERLERVDLPMRPHPFLREGNRVLIKHGPLAGLEGILLDHKPRTHLLVISVTLLQRSVAVEVDSGYVDRA